MTPVQEIERLESRRIISDLRKELTFNSSLTAEEVIAALDVLEEKIDPMSPKEIITAYQSGELDKTDLIAEGCINLAGHSTLSAEFSVPQNAHPHSDGLR